MPVSGQNLKLFSGSAHPELATLIARRLGIQLGDCTISTLPSGELKSVQAAACTSLLSSHTLLLLQCQVPRERARD